MINTRFWIDDYISNLDPSEKLLFLYFLTNPYTDICGVYEVPLKHVGLETGLDKEMVLKIVDRFSRDGKIFYENGWVAIKNFAKHQQDNPKVKKGIQIGLSQVPQLLLDRLSIDYGGLSHSNLNSNSNLNLNPNTKKGVKKDKNTEPREENTFFRTFWENFPSRRKSEKEKCFTKFMTFDTSLQERISQDVVLRATEHADWLKQEGEFVPAPIVYLNKKQWELPIIKAKAAGKIYG